MVSHDVLDLAQGRVSIDRSRLRGLAEHLRIAQGKPRPPRHRRSEKGSDKGEQARAQRLPRRAKRRPVLT